ncbi:MAG: DUF4160 domain-containing protein [Actinomycetota bacterium]|nr:DUF4160 domain-containing protein [Actinomycetota bacterium]
MPRISEFHGIIIAMYYRDHAPPHFHAIYGEFEAQIELADLASIGGFLPPRQLRLVQEWGAIHRLELQENWARARWGLPLSKIEPLP